jgi:hypothetical protein
MYNLNWKTIIPNHSVCVEASMDGSQGQNPVFVGCKSGQTSPLSLNVQPWTDVMIFEIFRRIIHRKNWLF